MPALCCTGVSSNGLSLATGSGNSFTSTVITTSDLAYPDLAYGSDGTAHISAGIDNGNAGLGYVAYAGGVATESTVTTESLADRTSIAVDSAGRPHIAYAIYTGTPGVYVATLDSGTWTSELVWSGDALSPRIAVESDGTNHVVFGGTDPDTGITTIRYSTDTTGSWVVSSFSTDPVDVEADIAVEASGAVDIAYAHQSAHGAGIFLSQAGGTPKLIARGQTDQPQMSLGTTGALYIAYWEFGGHGQGLHVTNNLKGRFVDSLIGNQGEGGSPMSVTVDSNGIMYAAFDIPGSCCPATGGLVVAHS
jgi:hypothetical protein